MYSKLGLGGERLNASDMNNLMNIYHRKAKSSFSNKLLELSNIKDAGLLLKNSGNVFHFLFESVERITYHADDSRWNTGLTFDYGNLVEDDITDVEIQLADDRSNASHSLLNVYSNRNDPLLLKTHQREGYYVKYWYSFTIVSIELDDVDSNGLYILTKVLDSGGLIINFGETTTLRESYGNIDILIPPVSAQNMDITGNYTDLMEDVFINNTNLIFFHYYDKGLTNKVLLGEMLNSTNVSSFKVLIINDNSSNSGIAVEDGLRIVSSSNTLLSANRYLHQHIISYSPFLNEEDNVFLNSALLISSTYTIEGIIIELGNSQNEFNELAPKSIEQVATETPLTNILLSFMKYITEFAIYNYTIQNYLFYSKTVGSDTVIITRNIYINPPGPWNDGDNIPFNGLESIVNNHLLMSGAFYHLGALTNANDGQLLSWQVN